MSGDVLVVGEALMDEVVEAAGTRRHPGGSPANVALGLGRLGVETRLHTAIGDDEDGRLIRAHLESAGVSLTPESLVDGPTSHAVASLAADGSATYRFALGWDPRDLDDPGEPRLIHTGSIAAFLEPGWQVAKRIIRHSSEAAPLITFDPNIRPGLVGDPETCRERFAGFAAVSDVIKLSDEDAAFLFPGEPLPLVLDRLLAAGAVVAAITRGAEGAFLGSGSHRAAIPPVEVSVADTVGAGDAFMAALIWSLVFDDDGGWDGSALDGPRLQRIGEAAARAAAITVSRPGADLPVLNELRAHVG
jgi:fructokinase